MGKHPSDGHPWQLLVQDILHACRHREGAGMPCLSLEIDDGPVFLTLLNMADV
jgi:hypothetical protein